MVYMSHEIKLVVQLSSIHQKNEQYGDQGPYMHGISDQSKSTTARVNYTYPQLVHTGHMHMQPYTSKFSQF